MLRHLAIAIVTALAAGTVSAAVTLIAVYVRACREAEFPQEDPTMKHPESWYHDLAVQRGHSGFVTLDEIRAQEQHETEQEAADDHDRISQPG